MQMLRFGGNVVGADPASGFTIPRLEDIAECFELEYQWIPDIDDLDKYRFDTHISPFQIIELHIDPDYVHYPRVATSFIDGRWIQDSMEDMTPKLPADELQEIMNA
jgi:hypothetical protein